MNSQIVDSSKTTNKWIYNPLMEGIKAGAVAFIISYCLSTLLSVIFNLTVVDHFGKVLQGNIGRAEGFSISNVVKVSSAIMNFSLFNRVGEIKIGLVLLATIPVVAFISAHWKHNRNKGLNKENVMLYIFASVVYTLLILVLSIVSRGNLLGLDINFVSIRNTGMTLFLTFLIQLAIGIGYNKDATPSIKATRKTLRLLLIYGLLFALTGMIIQISGFEVALLYKIAGIIIVLFNVAVYEMFDIFGIRGDISDDLTKLLAHANISYESIPIWIRIIMILMLVATIVYSLLSLKKERYFIGLIQYAVTFSAIAGAMAYCTQTYIGINKFIGTLYFGIPLFKGFIIPFIFIMSIGCIYFIILKIKKILTEE